MYKMCHGNLKNSHPIVILNDCIFINFVTNNSGNENSLSSPTKGVKYHYPGKIMVITW